MYEENQTESSGRWLALWWLTGRVCFCLAVAGVAVAQAQDCDLEVKIQKQNTVAYQARGDRCEGIYDQPVANRINLRVVGFHLGIPVFDPHKDDTVRITVKPYEASRKVLLRVISTRRHDYFQMDTSAIGNDGSFTWRLNVVKKLDTLLMPFDMAALACVSDCSRSNHATLLPVSIFGQAADAAPLPAAMTVLAMADVELNGLTATLRQGTETIFEDLSPSRPPLPPHKPIRIPINSVKAGEALLSLSAVTRSGQRDYFEAVLLIPELEK